MLLTSLGGFRNSAAYMATENLPRNTEMPATRAGPVVLPAADDKPSLAQVQQATETLQAMVQTKTNDLKFSIDNESGKIVVKVLSAESGEVLRQIPSAEMVALSHAMRTMQQGLLLRQSA